MKIIPAIDIIDGKCVRLIQGNYQAQRVYSQSPLDVALEFEDHGIEHLHVVDLDGARQHTIVNYKTLEEIVGSTSLKTDFGGGIKSEKDLRIAFDCGVHKVTVGSVAANKPMLFKKWLDQFGADKIILGADCRNRKIATQGWQNNAEIEALEFIRCYKRDGVKEVICTDINKDGMLQGPSFALYAEILSQVTVELIASGGITGISDIEKLKEIGCSGVIIGRAIYEGRITLKELQGLC